VAYRFFGRANASLSFRSPRLGFKDAQARSEVAGARASSWRDDNAKTIVDHCSRRRTDCSAQQNVVLINTATLREAERLIQSTFTGDRRIYEEMLGTDRRGASVQRVNFMQSIHQVCGQRDWRRSGLESLCQISQ